MADLAYKPVPHDREAFLARAMERKGFTDAYDALADEYALIRELRELLSARLAAGADPGGGGPLDGRHEERRLAT